jgi:hypothetical protein
MEKRFLNVIMNSQVDSADEMSFIYDVHTETEVIIVHNISSCDVCNMLLDQNRLLWQPFEVKNYLLYLYDIERSLAFREPTYIYIYNIY